MTNGDAAHGNRHVDTDQEKLDAVEATTDFLLSRTAHRPEIAIICGTGLGGLADLMEDVVSFPYTEIPNFVASTVKGHAGRLLFGSMRGKSVVCMHGRVHAYEGHSMWQVTFLIRVFHCIGVRVVIVTNASGALNPDFSVGDIMLITDHINLPGLAGLNPLFGLTDERFGARFPVLADAYDVQLQSLFRRTADELGVKGIREGVYVYQSGPCYETPAECRMLRLMGGDAAGMSTVPEVIVARHGVRPMRCLGLALITNKIQSAQRPAKQTSTTTVTNGHCTRQSGTDEHDAILSTAQSRTADLRRILAEFVARINC
jgi:purine-nucleoside phosphorylase